MKRKKLAIAVGTLVLLASAPFSLWLRSRFGVSPPAAAPTLQSFILAPLPPGPVLASQPAPQTAHAPATASFAVDAKDALSYQWQVSFDAGATFTDIPGAVYKNYITPPTNGSDAVRLLRVVVGNSLGGTTTSQAAQLAVTSTKLAGIPVSVSYSRGGVRVVVLPNLATNHRFLQGASIIQTIAADGSVTTLAGSDMPGYANGVGNGASFNYAGEAVADASGNVYVTDTANRVIRRITPAGVVSTFAGSGKFGHADGPATVASFDTPRKLAFDPDGNLYISDGNRIRKITPAGLVSTFAGGISGRADGVGTNTQFVAPDGLAIDPAGRVLYVADTGSSTIRKVTLPDGVTTTLTSRWSGGSVSEFYDPNGLALGATGDLYVTDWPGGAIRRVSPTGAVSLLAGTGSPGQMDGPAATARFAGTNGVAVDDAGCVWVSERINQDIRRISSGVVSTVVRSE